LYLFSDSLCREKKKKRKEPKRKKKRIQERIRKVVI
jgi:hypothetical protein